MASLLTADLPSEDEDDQDFVPEAEAAPKAILQRPPSGLEAVSATAQSAAKRAKVDAVWSMLNQKQPTKRAQQPQQQQHKGKLNNSAPATHSKPVKAQPETQASQQVASPSKEQASRALLAARAAAAGVLSQTKSATETRKFAGQKVEIFVEDGTQPVDSASAKAAKQKSSLDAVLSSLQATKKANVLDKSRGDWMAFKKSDQAANEELIAHTNSNKRYLDKVDFLKRAELNEYEQETAQGRYQITRATLDALLL